MEQNYMSDIVVIINGKPRSGKDTFCKYIEEWAESLGKDCSTWSTIDMEKEVLEELLGREYDPDGEWSSTDREFLSKFKQLLNEYYDYTFDIFKTSLEFIGGIQLIHSREWEEIDRMREYCHDKGIRFVTVYLSSSFEKNYNNDSDYLCDTNIENYDYYISNTKGLEELKKYARDFCDKELL